MVTLKRARIAIAGFIVGCIYVHGEICETFNVSFLVFWRTPRLHILVKTEKIGGIVFGLEFDQSLIVAAECCANCIRTFVPKKIHEAGMARERFERIRK